MINSNLDPYKRAYRLNLAKKDFNNFRKIYFPHYCFIKDESILQKELKGIYKRVISEDIGSKYAIAAPRAHAKTTDVAIMFVIYCIVFNIKHFITIFSDAIELSETTIEAIKCELECNLNLRVDFKESVGIGSVWKVGEIVTKNGIKVKGFGSSKRVRGIRHGVYRPDLCIIDDLENDINVASKAQRDKLEDWLDEAIGNLGFLDGKMDIIYIGTILHNDSVLSRKLKLSFWNGIKLKAIISYPTNMHLWDEYGIIYKRDGIDKAHKYYIKHKKAMNEGSSVLWSKAISIELLMRKRVESLKAFNKEYQNTPLNENQKFKQESIHYYTALPDKLVTYGFCDSAGSGKNSDYTSFTILGVNEEKAYVLESINKVISSQQIVKEIIRLQQKYKCKIFGFETNGGAFHLKNWILQEAFKRGVHIPLKGIHNKEKKESRIEELELPLENSQILLHISQTILIEQLLEFPQALNDDAPDSLSGAYRICNLNKGGVKVRNNRGLYTKKTVWE